MSAIEIRACSLCQHFEWSSLRTRADGRLVLKCKYCGRGVVDPPPASPDAIYNDAHFGAEQNARIGYSDYCFVAEHGTAWAASLARLLTPSGKVLDIGCADGHCLSKLKSSHELYGVEMNRHMAERCASHGIAIIGNDILAPEIRHAYSGPFDLVLAIAVFEHVRDFREAVEAALAVLKPKGILLFEVPVLSERYESDIWFQTSLEHIYYPTERALRYLFQDVLGCGLSGSELNIVDYGATFIGLASKDPARAAEADRLYRLLTGPVEEIHRTEHRTFRFPYGLIHAADASAEHLSLLPSLPPEELNPLLLRRLVQLWQADQRRRDAALAEASETSRPKWYLPRWLSSKH